MNCNTGFGNTNELLLITKSRVKLYSSPPDIVTENKKLNESAYKAKYPSIEKHTAMRGERRAPIRVLVMAKVMDLAAKGPDGKVKVKMPWIARYMRT